MDFAPVVYEHAARCIGRSPWDVSRDAGLLFEAHRAAFRLYGHRPVVVGIDIYNIEAEAYGAAVDRPPGDAVPAIARHPFDSAAALATLRPLGGLDGGRLRMVVEVAKRLAAELPGADVRVPISGPFSVASQLLGFEALLCDVVADPASVEAALSVLAEGQLAVGRAVVAEGVGVTLFESSAAPPLLSPTQFRGLVLPAFRRLVGGVRGAGGEQIPCIIGGDTVQILDDILATGAGYVICPFETDQAEFMRAMRSRPGVMVRINMEPELLVRGSAAEISAEVDRVVRLAGGRERVCVGTGVLPYDADPERVREAARCVRACAGPGEGSGEHVSGGFAKFIG